MDFIYLFLIRNNNKFYLCGWCPLFFVVVVCHLSLLLFSFIMDRSLALELCWTREKCLMLANGKSWWSPRTPPPSLFCSAETFAGVVESSNLTRPLTHSLIALLAFSSSFWFLISIYFTTLVRLLVSRVTLGSFFTSQFLCQMWLAVKSGYMDDYF